MQVCLVWRVASFQVAYWTDYVAIIVIDVD